MMVCSLVSGSLDVSKTNQDFNEKDGKNGWVKTEFYSFAVQHHFHATLTWKIMLFCTVYRSLRKFYVIAA